MSWTHNQVRGTIWALEHVMAAAGLSHEEMDTLLGVLLPKLVESSGLAPQEFRAILAAMDPDEGLMPPTQH